MTSDELKQELVKAAADLREIATTIRQTPVEKTASGAGDFTMGAVGSNVAKGSNPLLDFIFS